MSGFSTPPFDNLAWSTYAPTVTATVGTITTLGTVTGAYKLLSIIGGTGKSCLYNVDIGVTTNGTGATNIRVSLPFTPLRNCVGLGKEYNVTGALLVGQIFASNTDMTLTDYVNAYPAGNGYRLVVSGFFETT